MLRLRVFIVLLLSWAIIAEAPAATTAKAGGTIILESLKEKFYSAAHDPALQKVTAERAIRTIVTLSMPAEPLPAFAPPTPSPRFPIQLEHAFHLLRDRATSYEKTLYMEWFMLGYMTNVNLGSILDAGLRSSIASNDAIYIGHAQACYKLYHLIDSVSRGTLIPATGTMVQPDGKIYHIVTVGPEHSYFNTDLHPDITGPQFDLAAAATGNPNCKTGFLKFFLKVKTAFYFVRVFQSPNCILEGIPYQLSCVFPSQTINFPLPGEYFKIIRHLFSDVSHQISVDFKDKHWYAQKFNFLYDNPYLAAVSSPAITLSESEIKDKEAGTFSITDYPFRPGIILREELAHNPNLYLQSPAYSLFVTPTEKDEKSGKTTSKGVCLKSTLWNIQLQLDATSIFSSLTALGGDSFAFARDRSSPSPSVITVKLNAPVPTAFTIQEQVIGTGIVHSFTDGPPGITYLFEQDHNGASLVHVLRKPDLAKMITAPFNHVGLLTYALTRTRNLIALGHNSRGEAILDIVRLTRGPSEWTGALQTINLGVYSPTPNMFYFPPSSRDENGEVISIPGNITFTGPKGTRVVRGIPD